jgi:uncharacterized protein
MKIRSVTMFAKPELPFDVPEIAALAYAGQSIASAYVAAGYEVQTLRYATDLFPALAALGNERVAIEAVLELEHICLTAGFDFVALGPAGPRLQPLVPEIIAQTETVFATSHLVDPESGTIDGESLRGAAQVIHAAAGIAEGFGNLRYAALANVAPGTPFFPAAYSGPETPAFAIATESADLAVNACTGAPDAAAAHDQLERLVASHGQRLGDIAQAVERTHPVRFLGIDFSLAPYPGAATSIGGALEALTGQPLGAAGTLSAAATLTDAVQRAAFRHVGFCGLMMPVLEDSVLAQRAAEATVRVSDLLQWSSVCGTGLDTVPLPGDTSTEALAALLLDVATLSVRLKKPLTARLMPLPGKRAGDPVHFDFAYFADGGVLALSYDDRSRPISRLPSLALTNTARRD